MIALLADDAYTAARWTSATTRIQDLAWLPLIDKVYAINPVTGVGFVGYTRGDRYPTLSMLTQGVDYLFDVSSDYALVDATASPAGAFAAFLGYVPPTADPDTTPTTPATTPATGPGFIATAIAAEPIIAGSIVARTEEGVVPHSAKTLDRLHLLFGVAVTSALAGGSVSVQRGGYILIPGLGLTTGATLFVGDNGKFATSNEGLAFSQIVGRAISPDEFIYQPESITILYPFSLQVL